MAKQTINIGSGELAGDGESLRSAFNKTNSNFNELYSSVITASNIASNLIPAANNIFDLGSSSTQWRSLYVGTSTIYLGGVPLSVGTNGNLLVSGNPVQGTGGSVNKLTSGTAKLELIGSVNPYVVFPSAFGESIYIQGNEVASANGNLALTSQGTVVINANVASTLTTWAFLTDGTIQFPDGTIQSSAYVSQPAGGEFTFTNTILSTPNLSFNNTSTQIVSGPKAYILNKISVSTASWVRVYISSGTQQNDLLRSIDVDPVSTTGIVAEAITTQSGTVVFSPGINGFNNETTPVSQIPVSVTYLGAGTASVSVTLHFIRLIS